MAYDKKNSFEEREQALADFAKALSHPARITILKTLASKKSCICGEIVNILPLAQSTVSQHLKELKKAGLVQGEIDGPRSCYCINWERWSELSDQFVRFVTELQESEKC